MADFRIARWTPAKCRTGSVATRLPPFDLVGGFEGLDELVTALGVGSGQLWRTGRKAGTIEYGADQRVDRSRRCRLDQHHVGADDVHQPEDLDQQCASCRAWMQCRSLQPRLRSALTSWPTVEINLICRGLRGCRHSVGRPALGSPTFNGVVSFSELA